MKKKLLIVTHHLTIGGVQKSLISALKALDYDKYEVTLYLRKNRTTLLPYIDKRVNVIINEDPHRYYRKPYAVILQIISFVFSLLGFKEKAKKYDKKLADIIRKWSMEYERKTYFCGKKYDKAIAYVQGYTVQFVDEYINAEEKYMFFHTSTDEIHEVHEKALCNLKKIASLHSVQKELIKEWYGISDDRIAIVENYVDKDMIVSQSEEYSPDTPQGKVILCSCGRLSSVKGFDIATECAKILKDKGCNFLWYFVGDGPEKEKLLELTKKYGLEEDIVITGMKENPYPYMKAADIYIQPSYEEALGLTIVEAQKLSKPVVTTATVGGKKLVENEKTGLIAGINAESLAENIIRLLNEKELYVKIKTMLESTDDSCEFQNFKLQWKKFLEE